MRKLNMVVLALLVIAGCSSSTPGGNPDPNPQPQKEIMGFWVLTAQDPAELPAGWPVSVRVKLDINGNMGTLHLPAPISDGWNEITPHGAPVPQLDMRIISPPTAGTSQYRAGNQRSIFVRGEATGHWYAVFTYYQNAEADTLRFTLPLGPVLPPDEEYGGGVVGVRSVVYNAAYDGLT